MLEAPTVRFNPSDLGVLSLSILIMVDGNLGEDTVESHSNESRHVPSDISSERSDAPLPIWQWDENSCSLDQILLIGLLILLTIGNVDLQCSSLAFEHFHGFISLWYRDGSWDSWLKER
jgi:hypothetical protein